MSPYECERNYGHSYDSDGSCSRCGDYDEDYDENFEDDDDEVTKTWNNGKRTTNIYISQKWLDRAKVLLREQKVISVDEAYKVAEILEQEMRRSPFDTDVANIVTVAFRETESEREVMAARLAQIRAKKAAKTDQPDTVQTEEEPTPEPEGGRGLEAVKATARKGQRRRAMLEAMQICMIPDCGCDGTPHP